MFDIEATTAAAARTILEILYTILCGLYARAAFYFLAQIGLFNRRASNLAGRYLYEPQHLQPMFD